MMPLTCPVDFDVKNLRAEIQSIYARVAAVPDGEFHFHRGPEYAAAMLGYDPTELASLPPAVTSSFAGIGNPHAIGPIPEGSVVLDVGCGAGTDLLLAARRTGPRGRAIGVDMTEPMRARAIEGAAACALANVEVLAGDATQLPVETGSVDVVISNGVLNLVPEKRRAIAEMARVLNRGGRIQVADIVIGEMLPESALCDVDLWTG
jgi:arsenite methyltransferase